MGDRAATGLGEVSADRRPRAHATGRVCAEKGCATKLSIYNDGDHCALHAPMFVPRMRGKKIA